jgi:hypothetical protein
MKPRCGGDASAACEALNAHVRETVLWHFSPETGTPPLAGVGRRPGLGSVDDHRGHR